MSTQRSFALPDVGEGLTEAEILRWHVEPGDAVKVNQSIVEIETAKASVELPCPFAGRVSEVLVPAGALIAVGTPIIVIETEDAQPEAERQPVLVGYGVRDQAPGARRRRRRPAEDPPAGEAPPADAPEPGAVAGPAATARAHGPARAKPPVRHLARELGVDLSTVAPSGPRGDVTRADVLAASGGQPREGAPAAASPGFATRRDERVPVRGVQRSMAEAMVQSAFTAPHVSEWVDVDMSRSLEVVERLRSLPEGDGVRITPMVLVAAGLIRAARRHPRINSSWIDASEGPQVLVHGDVHLGIAADTPRGLLVPCLKGADRLGLMQLARGIHGLIDTARAGRATPADLTGGTITLTNIGVFGIDGGTPILSPGQTAILAMGRILDRPWVVDGSVSARPIMQLSLSFDHRVIDGALGSRALRSVADFLTDPALSLLADSEGG